MKISCLSKNNIVFLTISAIFLWQSTDMPANNSQAAPFISDISANTPMAKQSSIVELQNGDIYELTASIVQKDIQGNKIKMFAYNGSIPGPTIKIKQGSTITIVFNNKTDVPLSLHSHGIRIVNKFDGVPGITQSVVQPGESFVYNLPFNDPGVYWYHPHIREDYTQELGLYGNFIVEPIKSDYWNPVNREIALFVDDVLLGTKQSTQFDREKANYALMGRFGNVMLINGQTDYTINAKVGEVIRFFITNSANTRPFNIKIPGAKMKLVGGDNGRVSKEQMVDSVVLSPGERSIIEVMFVAAGNHQIINQTPQMNYKLGDVLVGSEKIEPLYDQEFYYLRENQEVVSKSDWDKWLKRPIDKSLKISIDMNTMPMNDQDNSANGHNHQTMNHSMYQSATNNTNIESYSDQNLAGIEWEDNMTMMNIESTSQNTHWKLIDQQTNKENMDIDWQFKQNDIVKIRIFNDPNSMHPMQHPIHLHGQRFLVLSTDGKPNQNPVWKDTTLIRSGETVELLVEMSNKGVWPFHCHIPEHMESGMMFNFSVI